MLHRDPARSAERVHAAASGVASVCVATQPGVRAARATDRPSGNCARRACPGAASARRARPCRRRPARPRRRARRTRSRTAHCASPGRTGATTGRSAPRTRRHSCWRPARPRVARALPRKQHRMVRPPRAAPDARAASPRRRSGGAFEIVRWTVRSRPGAATTRPRPHCTTAWRVAIEASRAKQARQLLQPARQRAARRRPAPPRRRRRRRPALRPGARLRRSSRWRRVYSACSGVRASQRSMIARARGPACASSASQTRRAGGRAGVERGQAGIRARRRRRPPAPARRAAAADGAHGQRTSFAWALLQRLHRAEAAGRIRR